MILICRSHFVFCRYLHELFLILVVQTDSRVDKYDDDDRPRRENCVRHALELLIMHFLLDGVDIFGRR